MFFLLQILNGIGELAGVQFHINIQRVGIVRPIHFNAVIGGVALFQKHCFNLRGEDINAPDDQHIVASAHGLAHFYKGSAAGAFFPGQYADIPGAVPQQREGFFG